MRVCARLSARAVAHVSLPAPAVALVCVRTVRARVLHTVLLLSMVKHLHVSFVLRPAIQPRYTRVGIKAQRPLVVLAAVGTVRGAVRVPVAAGLLVAFLVGATNVRASGFRDAARFLAAVTELALGARQAVLVRLEEVLGAGLELVKRRVRAFDDVVVFLWLAPNRHQRQCDGEQLARNDPHRARLLRHPHSQ